MSKHISLIFIFIFTAVIVSCDKVVDNRLKTAEALVEDNPDSALYLLNALNREKLGYDKNRYIYDILLTEARYKSGLNDTCDTVIADAVKYFESKTKSPYRLKAYYYKSILNWNNEKYGNALILLKESETSACAIKDVKWLALIHRSQADMFDATMNFEKALTYYKKSLSEFIQAESRQYVGDALYDCSRTYLNLQENDSAIIAAERLLEWADSSESVHSKNLAISNLGAAYYNKKEYANSIRFFETLRKGNPEEMTSLDFEYLGLSYYISGNKEKAEECASILNRKSSPHTLLLRQIAMDKGNWKEAMHLMEISRNYNDSLTKVWIARSQDAILYEKFILESENSELQKSNKIMWMIISVVLLFTFLLCLWRGITKLISHRREKKRLLERIQSLESDLLKNAGAMLVMGKDIELKQLEIDNANRTLSYIRCDIEKLKSDSETTDSLKKDLETKLARLQQQESHNSERIKNLEAELKDAKELIDKRQKAISEGRQIIEKTLGAQYRLLDSLASKYYEIKGDAYEKKKMYDEIMKTFESIKSDRNTIESFERIINQRLDNLMVKFRIDYPKMSESDIVLFIFSVLDFSSKSISVFLDIPVSRLYNRRFSLKNKISENNSVDTNYYLSFL